MTTIQAIMTGNISELEDACNEPLAPDPHTPEADFMLPENRPIDHRISTTATEDEFECDRCNSAFYRLITRFGVSYARCTECGNRVGWECRDFKTPTLLNHCLRQYQHHFRSQT
jgi:hypothetical protein